LTPSPRRPSIVARQSFFAVERNRDGRRRCLGGTTNVLLGGSNRTVALQPISLNGQTGLNLAIGVAALQLGLPRQ
jgi:hypothetical protein